MSTCSVQPHHGVKTKTPPLPQRAWGWGDSGIHRQFCMSMQVAGGHGDGRNDDQPHWPGGVWGGARQGMYSGGHVYESLHSNTHTGGRQTTGTHSPARSTHEMSPHGQEVKGPSVPGKGPSSATICPETGSLSFAQAAALESGTPPCPQPCETL